MEKFLEFLRSVAAFLGRWFDLPDLDNEAKVRQTARNLIQAMKLLALTTKPKWDDQMLKTLSDLVENDMVWALIYSLLRKGEGEILVGEDDPAVVDASTRLGLGPLTIIAMIKTLLTVLWKLGILSPEEL